MLVVIAHIPQLMSTYHSIDTMCFKHRVLLLERMCPDSCVMLLVVMASMNNFWVKRIPHMSKASTRSSLSSIMLFLR
jgi:hypothetical protein